MLVPIVWFEESAQIPEEAARKFKSMYTDRIRLINLTLLSLFLASLVLLAIDLRLMINTHYWRRFKFVTTSALSGVRENPTGKFRQKEKSNARWHRDTAAYTHTSSESDGGEAEGEDGSDRPPSQAASSALSETMDADHKSVVFIGTEGFPIVIKRQQ